MLFKFLSYLQPTQYFGCQINNETTVYPNSSLLPESILNQLECENDFETELAKSYDLAWQAIHKGYIGTAETISEFEDVVLVDEYRFIRKYFSKAWVVYVLLLRLFSFNNPLSEWQAFFKSKEVRRSTYLHHPISYKHWEGFESKLIQTHPKVTVIIPTLNRYQYLKEGLHDLEKQAYTNFEITIVDQSYPFQADFYNQFQLDLNVIHQEEKALWAARNTAISLSENELFLLFDDDSRVDKDWIENHLKCLDFFDAAISAGVSISQVGAEVPRHYSFFKISDQLDTGNVLIKREVFEKIGLFDRQFEKQRMGDGEFGLRAYLAGFLNVSNPYAKRLHLKVDSGGLREMGSWDAFRTKKWFAPRPIPSVLYFFRSYFGNSASKLALMRTIPMSIMPYHFKKNKSLKILGAVISILIFPLILVQVMRSWQLASKKIKEGPLIDSLN